MAALILPASVEEALAACRAGAVPLAGGTWLMRDPVRGVALPARVVALSRLPGLCGVEVTGAEIRLGAGATHAAIAAALRDVSGAEALAAAAEGAANPAIRRVATLGGNLCTPAFAAADLVPALLALDARVELAEEGAMALTDFLPRRAALLPGAILTGVRLPRDARISAHARLPLRKAGDYPVAIVSLARTDEGIRVAVGSVEPVARRWTALEAAFAREPGATPDRAAVLAREAADFTPRDGIEAPGWYRVEVLPALVRRAFAQMEAAR